jgi:cytidyltransferase-like protein
MKFRDFLTEARTQSKVIVVYGGGFQPFHAGHMSSYEQAKSAFPSADFYVAASNDTKNRPIPFKDKQFLAQQAGVKDKFVQVSQPVNPTEILSHYNPKKDILILVRSERDPVNYTKKDGSPAYYQPFKSLKECVPFNPEGGHGYIFVTKKHVFKVNGEEVYSGSQIRSKYAKADDKGKQAIIKDLYPKANQSAKVKKMLDKYIGGLKEDIDEAFTEILTEGVHDKAIFKAVFLAGGPGSGKDYVLDNTLAGHGLTEINSDKALEFLMDKKGLDKTMPASETEARDVVRGKAKSMTELRQKLAILGRNGLIINGTGDDVEKITKIKKRLEEIGYDSSMILVNTEDEISKQRNIERGQRGGRTVPEKIRKEKWDNVQAGRPEFAKLFGDKYMEFDNSEDLRNAPPEVVKQKKDEMLQLFTNVKNFVAEKPSSPVAKQWVANELSQKDTLPVKKGGAEQVPHPDSGAADQARKLGLQYYGFGRYGKNGVVTHRSVHDELVEISKDEPKEPNVPISGSSMKKPEPKAKKVNEEFEQLFETKVTKKTKLLRHDNGKLKTFMLRRSAAKEAHTINGTVMKNPSGGYVVKIKEENEDVKSINQLIETETGRETSRSGSSASRTNTSASTSSRKTTSEETSGQEVARKITIAEIRKRKEAQIKESIDMGIEPSISMAASGENLRSTVRKKRIEELTGDETTLSNSAEVEGELKRKGINLKSFKASRYGTF